jgi:signal transduction histidine kinase
MNRRAIAVRLTVLVALAGLIPIAVTGLIGIEVLRRRSATGSEEALHEVAAQAAGQLSGYLDHQRQLLRAVAAVVSGPEPERPLEHVVLDVPSLGEVTLVRPGPVGGPGDRFSPDLVAAARAGEEAQSEVFLSADGFMPAIDACAPARALPDHVVCARLDLVELWPVVRKIKVGDSGYALVFDGRGRLWASGNGDLRKHILTGEEIPQSRISLEALVDPRSAARRYERSGDGEKMVGGWARLEGHGWAVVVEQPLQKALQPMRAALWLLIGVLLFTLLVSLLVGVTLSQRVLRGLEIEERWRTAGRIAAGITHDLGHRLRVLQQTAGLAEAQEPAFLQRIAENLRAEVGSLQKFIADFSDLSRDVRTLELTPLELGAFLESVRRAAFPHAEACGVSLEVRRPESPVWTRADRHLLERAALNLLSNAIEASPRGSVVQLAARGGPRAVLEVSDQGPGISAARLQNLFDAFVSTKRTGAHLGVGLANVKRIAEAHGGRVQAQSEEGKGARFWIELPPAPAPEDLQGAA